MKHIIIAGSARSGKTTLAAMLKERFPVYNLFHGDCIREWLISLYGKKRASQIVHSDGYANAMLQLVNAILKDTKQVYIIDADMIGDTVLAVGFDLIPVKVNDVAGIWGVTAVLPLIAGPKPALARYASSGFGNNACVDIPALIGTPGNKARTPLYTGIKTHVRPIGVA